jgi:hypothetical protein
LKGNPETKLKKQKELQKMSDKEWILKEHYEEQAAAQKEEPPKQQTQGKLLIQFTLSLCVLFTICLVNNPLFTFLLCFSLFKESQY